MFKLFLISVTLAVALAVGGYRVIDSKDDHVSELVDFATEELNARSNSILARKVMKVTKAQRQLVNGFNYKIDFVFALTKCNKQSSADQLSVCDVYGDRDQVCSVTIYETFSGNKQLSNFNCASKQSKRAVARGCAGCVSDEKKNPQDFMDLYIRAFGLANTNLDADNVQILSVRTQVVSGTKYYMKVKTSEAGQPRLCDVTFVLQPWLTPNPNNVKFDCQPTFCK